MPGWAVPQTYAPTPSNLPEPRHPRILTDDASPVVRLNGFGRTPCGAAGRAGSVRGRVVLTVPGHRTRAPNPDLAPVAEGSRAAFPRVPGAPRVPHVSCARGARPACGVPRSGVSRRPTGSPSRRPVGPPLRAARRSRPAPPLVVHRLTSGKRPPSQPRNRRSERWSHRLSVPSRTVGGMRPVSNIERTVAPFEVVSPYQPNGDQPAAIAELDRRIRGVKRTSSCSVRPAPASRRPPRG